MQTKLVTAAYYNIEGHPHYGANRAGRMRYSLVNIAKNTNLPIVCYTSKKYGCYDELQELFNKKNITNVTLKVFELEDHPLHEKVLAVRELQPHDEMRKVYEVKPIIVYWSKFLFLLNELTDAEYIYWIDAGLSHNGMFPVRYAIGNTSCFGMADCSATFDFSCFSQQSFNNINNFVQNKVLHVVRVATDADVGAVTTIPELQEKYYQNCHNIKFWPIAGIFGGHSIKSPLKQYLEKMNEIFEIVVRHDRITVEEGVMAYVDVAYTEWFKRYHFENFYTEHELARNLHWRVDENGVEDGTIYHHFYRLFCDDGLLVDCLGQT